MQGLPNFDGNKYIEKYKNELSGTVDRLLQTETVLETAIEELTKSQERVSELEEKLAKYESNDVGTTDESTQKN